MLDGQTLSLGSQFGTVLALRKVFFSRAEKNFHSLDWRRRKNAIPLGTMRNP